MALKVTTSSKFTQFPYFLVAWFLAATLAVFFSSPFRRFSCGTVVARKIARVINQFKVLFAFLIQFNLFRSARTERFQSWSCTLSSCQPPLIDHVDHMTREPGSFSQHNHYELVEMSSDHKQSFFSVFVEMTLNDNKAYHIVYGDAIV